MAATVACHTNSRTQSRRDTERGRSIGHRRSRHLDGSLRSRVWAEAGNPAGGRVAAMLETGEGYRAASAAAVRALELQQREPRVGALTPVQAFGSEFASLVPGTRIEEIEPSCR
jgi:short subunit dehydrogenase-like uncharacterized protein